MRQEEYKPLGDKPEFRPWPKIARLNRDIVISEKLDGTNAAIGILEDGTVYAQSRTRIITPEKDNFGFARWVADRADALREFLGVGLHFGEWYGLGIQRGYGLKENRFALFNTTRWALYDGDWPEGLETVPVMYEGPFKEWMIEACLTTLRNEGSRAVHGFMQPEGVVVYHTASNGMFKVTLENDEKPKGQVEREAVTA